jgi:hypothetical protein
MRFCGQCGQPLSIACRACGKSNDADQRFCGHCGVNLEPIAAPEQGTGGIAGVDRPSPTVERRHVSVLFADLVGFTSLYRSGTPRMFATS